MKKSLSLLISAMLLCPISSFAGGFADVHTQKGVPCEACHVNKDKPQTPAIDQCTACHELGALVKKTEKTSPRNPHVSPHYKDRLDCVNCHVGHEPSENYCDSCHTFKFKVP